jgi:hypothetical protein
MSSDRYAPPEPDQDAYEDAWYRALKAKAARRFRDPQEKTVEPSLPEPPSTKDEQGPERASS